MVYVYMSGLGLFLFHLVLVKHVYTRIEGGRGKAQSEISTPLSSRKTYASSISFSMYRTISTPLSSRKTLHTYQTAFILNTYFYST